jgi:hypothetical protein
VRLLLSRELRPMAQGAPAGALAAQGARLARALRQRSAPACGSAACDNLTHDSAFDFWLEGVG